MHQANICTQHTLTLVNTHTRTHTHSHTHTHAHTLIQTHTYPAPSLANRETPILTNAHAPGTKSGKWRDTHSHKHTHAPTRTHTSTHTRTWHQVWQKEGHHRQGGVLTSLRHTHTHTHTNAHIHIQTQRNTHVPGTKSGKKRDTTGRGAC
jgi:hypothetical protein